ncbi:MAG: DUF4139 domain-containing protein [Planctomycetes bacterium]|nr:DUF4139 domain-containing protein [Planctomycetota bacterium]
MIPILLMIPLGLAQAPDAVQAESRIDRVTVYSGYALVERRFSAEAGAPGPRAVVLGPLPLGAEASSFQARVDGGPAKVQGLQMQRRTGELASSDRDRLRAQLDGLAAEVRELRSEEQAIQAASGVLDAAVAALTQSDQLDPARLSQLLDFVSTQTHELDQRQIVREREERRLKREVADLESRIGGGGGAARPYQQARVNLFFERAGRAELRLQYLVRGAAWRPIYEVRLDPELNRVDVGLTGEIRQATEEDWEDAQLVLSTARPHVGLDPPELPQRWVSLSRPERARRGLMDLGYSAGDDSASMAPAAGAYLRLKDGEEAFVPAPVASVQDYGLSQQFLLPERVTVAADDEPKTFPLVQVPLDVRPERYVVPSLSLEVFLRAEVTSAADAPLLPGEARVFLGPDFLGKAGFPLLRPGDSTWLNLGLDPNLVVEYALVRDEREEPGVFSDTVRLHRAWETRLRLSASSARPVTVLIEEALPLSTDERIAIEIEGVKPEALKAEADLKDREEKGLWRWRVKLQPGQETAVRWGWKASFDEDLRPVFSEG